MCQENSNRRLAAALIAVCMLAGGSAKALAQAAGSEPAASGASEVVELPALIADLFRSSPGGAAPPPNAVEPAATPPGPATPPLPGSSSPALPTSGDFVPDEVIVTVEGDGAAAQQIAADLGLQVRSTRTSFLLGTTVARFGIPDGRSVGSVLAQLSQDGRARNSGANHIYTIQQATPVKGFAFTNIAFESSEANGAGVRIAVIDTARDTSHPAFAGMSVIDSDQLPELKVNDTAHGTEIVGLIAGQNAFQGLAPGATILHARAFDIFKPGGKASSTVEAINNSIDWAAQNNAQIINMSFAGPRNQLLEEMCAAAAARGILLVAAAGNEGPFAPPAYPGASKGVIAITATDEQNRRMDMANVGTYVRMSAPGVGVLVPVTGGGFDMKMGTSHAAAVYSGALASLMHRQPGKSGAEIVRTFDKTALDLGEKGRDIEFGFGLVNVKAALAAAE